MITEEGVPQISTVYGPDDYIVGAIDLYLVALPLLTLSPTPAFLLSLPSALTRPFPNAHLSLRC